jgi:proline iminopeptidase
MLDTAGIHRIYWETSGNPDGIPVLFVHGGPGSGTSPKQRQFFDPARYRIVLFDQRGCGRSTPHGELVDNTTPHLIADMEALRRELGVDKWLVFGGSWGSTLALAYAEAHPDRCLGLVLRGIFLCRKSEIDWFLYGIRAFFPEAQRQLAAFIPERERDDLLGAYHRRLVDPDPAAHQPAAHEWDLESSCRPRCRTPNWSPHSAATRPHCPVASGHYFATTSSCPTTVCSPASTASVHPGRDRAGALRRRLPHRDRRRTGTRLAGSSLCDRCGCRPFCVRAGHRA